ncbi:hypothetical protein B9J78_04130 [bacterium Unc6]|nr:hypothetical protein [bacterium Unc6]
MYEAKKSDYGVIRIKRQAIVSVADIAANSVEGVKRIQKDFFEKLLKFFSISGFKSGLQVHFTEKHTKVSIQIVAKYGANLPDIAHRVQENVKNAIEKMANLSSVDVNVDIVEVEKEEKQ